MDGNSGGSGSHARRRRRPLAAGGGGGLLRAATSTTKGTAIGVGVSSASVTAMAMASIASTAAAAMEGTSAVTAREAHPRRQQQRCLVPSHLSIVVPHQRRLGSSLVNHQSGGAGARSPAGPLRGRGRVMVFTRPSLRGQGRGRSLGAVAGAFWPNPPRCQPYSPISSARHGPTRRRRDARPHPLSPLSIPGKSSRPSHSRTARAGPPRHRPRCVPPPPWPQVAAAMGSSWRR